MPALITDGDIAYLRTLYPTINVPALNPQQERALMLYMKGMTPIAAGNAAGMTPGAFGRLLDKEGTQIILSYVREREFSDVRISRDTITSMFLEAYHRAGCAMEMVAATRELAKLHGMYPENKPNVTVNVAGNSQGTVVEINMKKLERMSDQDLLKMAPELLTALDPPKAVTRQEEAVEAEIVELAPEIAE